MRYHRRISVNDNLKLNVSKSGITPSVKVGRVTVNPKRGITYNTPIKGLSLNSKNSKGDKEMMGAVFGTLAIFGAIAIIIDTIVDACKSLCGNSPTIGDILGEEE